jgi:hypothetical protein
LTFIGKWHCHSQLVANLFSFPNDHVEDSPINRVVVAVHQRRAHNRTGLPEAIDTTLSLFVASGIPGQVVVHDRIESTLKIHTFRQAVRCNQQAPLGLADGFHLRRTFLASQLPGDDTNVDVLEVILDMLPQVVGGGDVSAKHHGAEPVCDKLS